MRVQTTTGTLSYTDGQTIFVASRLSSKHRRTAIVIQAALIAGGGLDRAICARSKRRSFRHRYLVFEVDRVLRAFAHVLPDLDGLDWASLEGPLCSRSPAESARLAQRRFRIPAAPAIIGRLNVSQLPRAAAADRAKPNDPNSGKDGHDQAQPDAGAESAASRVFVVSADTDSSDSTPKTFNAGIPVETAAKRRSVASVRRETILAIRPRLTGAARHRVQGTDQLYPEWNRVRSCYLQNHCTILQYDAIESPDVLWSSPAVALRADLARLGLGFELRKRQIDGEDVDVDAAIRFMLDAAAGFQSRQDIYVGMRKTKPDLAALVLVDLSGSIRSWDGTEDLHREQLKVAARLTAAFSAVGHSVAVVGFRSFGRTDVRAIVAKSLLEPTATSTYRRIAGLQSGGFTRLGASLRHGTSILVRETAAAYRLLVVVSDGVAFDDEYETDYGIADSNKALEEARDAGIATVGLTIGANRRLEDDALEASERIYVTKPEQIDQIFGPAVRRALRATAGAHSETLGRC